MALPNSGGGYQLGDGNANEPIIGDQGDITSGLTSAVTLTAAQIATGIISTTPRLGPELYPAARGGHGRSVHEREDEQLV